LLSGALGLAVIIGLFIEPDDSQANPNVATWYAEYYPNNVLDGKPVLTRSERELNYNWSNNAPAANLPDDQFSIRWTGSFDFEQGQWVFSAGADDGIRLWLDDNLLIDQWEASGTYIIHTAETQVSEGTHNIKVEYYDSQGLAGIDVKWQKATATDALENPSDVKAKAKPETAPLSPSQQGYAIANVATGTLNVRNGPGIGYERIAQIYLYQRFPILGKNSSSSWYLIDLKDNRSGWVAKRYIIVTNQTGSIPVVDVAPPAQFSGVAGVATANLNIRAAATASSDRLGTVPDGTAFTVQARNATSAWYLTNYDGTPGWVYAPYVELDDDANVYDIPFSDAAFDSDEIPFEFDGARGLTLDYMNIRDLPSTINGDIIAKLPVNTEVPVFARNTTSAWYLIEYQGTRGWVYAPYIELLDGVRPFNIPFIE
jgi:uncharacterized protein YgiM (DUF1202 family)